MIDLRTVSRVRLRRGRNTHAVKRDAIGLFTLCQTIVKLVGPNGDSYDQAMPAEAPVTCPACQRVERRAAE